jgi:carboxypeptidase C (cathepsin A)
VRLLLHTWEGEMFTHAQFLQIFLSDPKFKKYAAHKVALWTESYGGHYGPVFSSYILDQNKV